MKKLLNFLLNRCECGGHFKYDGYHDRCDTCNKKE